MSSRFGSGQGGGRLEDRRLVTGRGRFVGDLRPDRTAHAVVLRSPHAHATIVAIDRVAAAPMPGVLAILTGADVLADGLGPIPCVSRPRTAEGKLQAIVEPPYRALAIERARYVGDAVAVVIAETVAQAKDAAERIVVDYQPLPAVTDTAAAAQEGAPALWPEAAGNRSFVYEIGGAKGIFIFQGNVKAVVQLELKTHACNTDYCQGSAAKFGAIRSFSHCIPFTRQYAFHRLADIFTVLVRE